MEKQRHGCLTAWLVLIIVVNVIAALVYLVDGGAIVRDFPDFPLWALPVLILACVANIVFAVALFRWRKWGFSGFVATTVVAFVVNLALGLPPLQLITGLLSVALLYGVLQIGGEKKGWTQLA